MVLLLVKLKTKRLSDRQALNKGSSGKVTLERTKPSRGGERLPKGCWLDLPTCSSSFPKGEDHKPNLFTELQPKERMEPLGPLSQMCHRVYKKKLRVTRGRFQTIFERHAWEPHLAGNTVEQECTSDSSGLSGLQPVMCTNHTGLQ